LRCQQRLFQWYDDTARRNVRRRRKERRLSGNRVVTDDAIYVLRSSVGAKPKELAGTLPRDHQLGPVSGVWAKIQLLGDRHWVHNRFHKVVQAADAERDARS
jgi:hypothetical protein